MRCPFGRGTAGRAPTLWRPFILAALMLPTELWGQVSTMAEPKESAPRLLPADTMTLTFGSQAILESCWSPEELLGSPAEKKGGRAGRSSAATLPERKSPRFQLEPLGPALWNSIRSVEPRDGRKVIALTFDLCARERETAGYDAAIVNYLRRNRVKATFFAGGKWMRSHPEQLLQLMADPLFEIGNHSWSHADLRVLTGEKMEAQVRQAQAQYELLWEELAARPGAAAAGPAEMNKIPGLPLVFRFPYGACSPESLRFVPSQGLPAVQWSIVTGDADPRQTATKIARAVLDQARPGAIIVAHANGHGHGTAAALPLFIPELQKRGYELVTVSELLASGPVAAAQQCYELKPGDNRRYDRLFGGKP
jgi:peptidoglycan-N-acetylglucosamine deacetylase